MEDYWVAAPINWIPNIKNLIKYQGEAYARNHPLNNATLKQWIVLINGKWSDKDWQLTVILSKF